jgi:hypothetical protein
MSRALHSVGPTRPPMPEDRSLQRLSRVVVQGARRQTESLEKRFPNSRLGAVKSVNSDGTADVVIPGHGTFRNVPILRGSVGVQEGKGVVVGFQSRNWQQPFILGSSQRKVATVALTAEAYWTTTYHDNLRTNHNTFGTDKYPSLELDSDWSFDIPVESRETPDPDFICAWSKNGESRIACWPRFDTPVGVGILYCNDIDSGELVWTLSLDTGWYREYSVDYIPESHELIVISGYRDDTTSIMRVYRVDPDTGSIKSSGTAGIRSYSVTRRHVVTSKRLVVFRSSPTNYPRVEIYEWGDPVTLLAEKEFSVPLNVNYVINPYPIVYGDTALCGVYFYGSGRKPLGSGWGVYRANLDSLSIDYLPLMDGPDYDVLLGSGGSQLCGDSEGNIYTVARTKPSNPWELHSWTLNGGHRWSTVLSTSSYLWGVAGSMILLVNGVAYYRSSGSLAWSQPKTSFTSPIGGSSENPWVCGYYNDGSVTRTRIIAIQDGDIKTDSENIINPAALSSFFVHDSKIYMQGKSSTPVRRWK